MNTATRGVAAGATHPTLILAAVAMTALGGCSERDAARSWQGRVDTLASGTVVVSNPQDGLWGEGEAWRFVEQGRVGDLSMEEPEVFAGVSDLLLDPAGRIYLLDRQSRRVQVFGPDGAYVRTIGREGEGPGELADPIGLAWLPSGDMLVVDPRNTRYTVFDTSGAFVTSHPRQLGGYSLPWRGHVDDEGHLSEVVFAGGRTALIRTDASFAPVDTLPIPRFEGDEFVLTTENAQMTAGVPFTSQQVETLGPSGELWVGMTGDYGIARMEGPGDTAVVVRKEAGRLPVTGADRDRAVEGLQWFTRQGGKVDPSRIPSEKPFFSTFFVGEDGHLWVVRTAPAEADSSRIDVFDPDGRYLGPVQLPFRPASNSLFGTDYLVTATSDSLGVPYVVRMRIEKGGGSL